MSDPLQAAHWALIAGIAIGAYLLGCLTVGYYLVRLRTGGDLRASGSGSVGARNAGRVLGRAGFLVTALSDAAKGALAVWVAQQITAAEPIAGLAMVCVVTGHLWPAQLRFKGGKGMATALGALLVFDAELALAFVGVFLVGLVILRRATVPALLALCCLPIYAGYRDPGLPEVVLLCVLAGLVLVGHRKNLMDELIRPRGRRVQAEPGEAQP